VHLLFVGSSGTKIAFHVGKTLYQPTMKGKKMIEEIIEQLAQAFKDDFQLVQQDFGVLEQMVQEKMRLLGLGLLQRLVDAQPNGYQGSSTACSCGGSMRFVQHRSRNVHTTFGWIKIKRAYYHCDDCGSSLVPYDRRSGLGPEHLSPGLAKACCLLAVDDSFEAVCGKIQQLFGQRVCDDSIQQVVHRVGKVALQQQDEERQRFLADKQIPQAQANSERLYISPDGTTVHENDGWHEVKLGCIWWADERFDANKRYVGCFEDSEAFGWDLWLEACRCGMRQAQEVVYLGDGAGWIRSEHHRHFSTAVFIVDWYHASQHIWDCGKTLFGEGTDATKRWVEHRRGLLWDGWTRRLLNDLKKQRQKYRGGKRKAIEALYHYISVNEQQMRYDVFRARGYQIGSGAVEAGCKHVVGKRLKQSGMVWSRVGSSATLSLRIAWLNGRWEQLWLQKPLAA
jgi:hypothetical protein